MRKFYFTTILLCTILMLHGQHQIKLSYSYAWLTTGDMPASSVANQYDYSINDRWSVGAGFDYTYGSAEGFYTRGENATVITQEGNYPFFDVYNESIVNEGWIVNRAKTTKSLYRSLHLHVNYDVLNSAEHSWLLTAGAAISLQDKTYQSEQIPGTFSSPLGTDQPITLVVPVHVNYYDYGYLFGTSYSYQLSEAFSVGANVSALFFGESEDRIYKGGVLLGVRF